MNLAPSSKIKEPASTESKQNNHGLHRLVHFLNDGIGSIETLRVECPSGINASRTSIKFHSHEDKAYYQNIARIECKELSLFIQIINNGTTRIQEKTSDTATTISPGKAYFCITQDTDVLYEFSRKEDIELISLTFPISICERLFGNTYLSNFIQNIEFICEIEKDLSLGKGAKIPLTGDLIPILESNFDFNMNLRIQQSAIDFLMTLTELYSQNRNKQDKLDPNSIAWIVYSELERMGGKIISYAEIEERFQISAKTINAEFLQIFGISIAKFAQKTRFKEASRLLKETTTPLKIISNMLGYSNVNNFILAFKKEFHYSPVRYRKMNKISVGSNNI